MLEDDAVTVAKFPRVAGEAATVEKLCEGFSIARFGDGEVKYMTGGVQFREPERITALSDELRAIIAAPHARCLAGILTMHRGPKIDGLSRHIDRFCSVLSPDVTYYSSLITRPDCAPWIDTSQYARMVQSLWLGKRAAVVCERKGSIAKTVRLAAREMVHVECPRYRAYAVIDQLMRQVIALAPEIVVISAGLTATCMANRLSEEGFQAVDLGSSGRFLYNRLTE